MDSIIVKVAVLIEVFCAGVILWIVNFLIHRYFYAGKKTGDIWKTVIFFFFFCYLVMTFVSQVYFFYDQPIETMALFVKVIGIALLAGSYCLLISINTRSKVKGDKTVIAFLSIVFLLLIAEYVFSPVTVAYNGSNLSPAAAYRFLFINLAINDFTQLIWNSVWVLFGLVNLWNIFLHPKEEKGKKILSAFSGVSAFLLLFAYSMISGHLGGGAPIFFLCGWLVYLFAAMGLGLGEAIDPESSLALNPLNYFRSRLLFKIIFGFILIVVVLFGGTNIIAIEMNKDALRKTVFDRYETIASEIAAKIDAQEKFDPFKAFSILAQTEAGKVASAYVVDDSGKLIAKTANLKFQSRQNLSGLFPVSRLMGGWAGSGEIKDESGESILVAFKNLKKYKGGVVVQDYTHSAYKEIRKLETDSLVNVIAGMALTILIALYFAGTIERPLKKLKKGTQAIADGDLNYQIETNSIDEFGELAQAYNRMTADLRETQNRLILSEKMIALGNMAAGMAHEIRNPLVSLRTFTQLLESQWEKKDFRDKFLTIVPREIERINRIAESLLKFGRPWKAEIKEVNIKSVLDEVLLLFEPEMKKRNVALKVKFGAVPLFIGDAPQLVQAFTNLIKNAIEAMGDRGGGDLLVETEHIMALKVKDEPFSPNEMTWGSKIEEQPYVLARISDTGGGIPKGKLRNLFDPFYTSKAYGTGMGLPITLRIIEEHKGTIKVKSKPEEGSVFSIYIPIKARENPPA